MNIGDVKMDPSGLYGMRAVECDCCVDGEADPGCWMCEGDGVVYELIAPEHELAEAVENIHRQLPENKH